MTSLNDPQRKAVLHPGGPLLLFAGAGSGKTRTLTYRIANLIAAHGVPPYRILAVTFTNKAAAEMRERLVQIVGEDIARDLYIGTFHGMAAKFLRRYGEAVGLSKSFTIYDDSDQKALVGRALKALGLDDRLYAPKAVLGRISAHKREGKDPIEMPVTDGIDTDLDALGREYQSLLGRADAVDFDDLLLKALKLVEDANNPAGRELRRKFEHVLVDEFQDTNWVQYRIVRALSAETRNLCVVGDDDQSIYRWRGADVRIIRGFKHDFPEAEVIKLEQNYRSTGNIVQGALGVIAKAGQREPKELWTSEPPGDPILVRAMSDERAEAAFVAAEIEKSRRQGTSASELAIFYRTHAQSRVLEEALRGQNVPYQIIGGMKFFERAEVKDMLSYLRVIANPKSDADLLRIINVPTRGMGQKSIAALLELSQKHQTSAFEAISVALSEGTLGAAVTKKLGSFYDLMGDLKKASETLRPSELLERVLGDTGYKKALELEDSAEADARLQNLAELIGAIQEYEAEAPQTGEEVSLAGYLERIALVSAVDTLSTAASVSMMTVHSAKGLEFERVWLTGMEEETFPYKGFNDDDPEDMDEERRLAYVAITRARKHLTITCAASRFLFGRTRYLAPSRFLDDLPAETVKREGPAERAGFGFSCFLARQTSADSAKPARFGRATPPADGTLVQLKPQAGPGVLPKAKSKSHQVSVLWSGRNRMILRILRPATTTRLSR
jgi:DNA helicase II / ATP-dependent DNA helicase PcrA